MLNPDFRDMLSAFNEEHVEYLVVGAYAMAQHGIVRATGDLDFWIRPTPENASRVLRALTRFGAPEGLVTIEDLVSPDTVTQLGVEPSRIDILTSIDGVDFDEAYAARSATAVDGIHVPLLGLQHLLANKRATGRKKDALDAEALEEVAHRAPSREGSRLPRP